MGRHGLEQRGGKGTSQEHEASATARRDGVKLDTHGPVTNNRTVPRRIVAAFVVAFVPLGALRAPLVHAHLDDHHSSHHAGRIVHAHMGHHGTSTAHPVAGEAGGAVLQGDETERTMSVLLFVAAVPLVSMPALPSPRYFLPRPLRSAVPRPPEVTHGHDPPATGRPRPRAPPA